MTTPLLWVVCDP